MKNSIKKWIALALLILFVALGSYFIGPDVLRKEEVRRPVTSTEQVKPLNIKLIVDYASEIAKQPEIYSISVDEDATAWDALQKVVGKENIEYKDYGGDLGIFVSGINGVKPTGNKFWLFKVNGNGSDVGVSSYKIQNGDKIEFVITEPEPGQ